MNIGERIRKKRKELKLTQSELGKLVSVSSQVISNWERGYSEPNHSDVYRLSQALDVSTEYLHGRSEEKSDRNNKELTEKDERDIAKRMEQIRKDLTSEDGLLFNGEPMSEEAIESFLEAMEYAVRQTQRINKKYIPKKYREKEND